MRLILLLIGIGFAQNSITVNSMNESDLNKLLTDRNGKHLLVNVWATW